MGGKIESSHLLDAQFKVRSQLRNYRYTRDVSNSGMVRMIGLNVRSYRWAQPLNHKTSETLSSQHQTSTLGFRHRIAKLFCCDEHPIFIASVTYFFLAQVISEKVHL